MRNTFFTLSIFFLFLFGLNTLCAQELFLNNREYAITFENKVNRIESAIHTSFKPYIQRNIETIKSDQDSIEKRSLIHRKIFHEDLITVNTEDFKMMIDPLFNFELGEDVENNQNTWVNTRGLMVKGSIGKQFTFYSAFYENQAKFSEPINDFVNSKRVIPGQGLARSFDDNAFDFSRAEAVMSYTPSKYFNFQFGQGKNFIGDGYRSLLLSDNSFTYPYFKITTNVWKFQYTNLFTSFINMQSGSLLGKPFDKKSGSFHLLSYNVTKRLELSFFEAIIWQTSDSNTYRGFDINYLNPIIFYRPVEFSLGSPDNALMGLNVKYKTTNNITFYGQFILDDFNLGKLKKGKGFFQEKYGFQIGIKANDLFKIENLSFQTEYNQVQPYVYAHKEPLQSYTHYNQALAHPLGANFKESVSFVNYKYKHWYVELKFNYAKYGADTANTHWGQDIFKSDYDAQRPGHEQSFGNINGQGLSTTLTYKDIRISYLVNPVTNLNISIGISDRIEKSVLNKSHQTLVYFGIRTSLQNLYYDF
jgi:hypothetical protein